MMDVNAKINDNKSLNDDDGPLVIKKLVTFGNKNWKAYSTLDEMEQPKTIELNNHSNNLLINGAEVTRKLVLDGAVSQCNVYDSSLISRLLKHVESCNLSILLIHYQKLSCKEYEKLVHGGNIKNVYFDEVTIENEGRVPFELDAIMEKLPNIEQFRCTLNRDDEDIKLSKVTFVNLLKLPKFENLKWFSLSEIYYDSFDADSFLCFIKKHPETEFTLYFRYDSLSEEQRIKIKATAAKLQEAHPDKLRITYIKPFIFF